ncbi:hypothetical protein QTP88_000926 [Uroleucon formosanum]
MEVEHGNNVTATGASETPEPTVEGSRAPQKSLSATSAKSMDVLKQASSANQEVGTATVGEGGKQASAGGKTIEATATAHKEKIGNAPNLTDVTSGSLASRLLASNKQQGCPSNMLLAMTKLKLLIKAQNLLINKLCQGADCLGELGKLTRSDHVKGGIVEISLIVDEVAENRKQLLPAFNEALQLAIKLANGPEPCSTMPTPTDQNAANLQNQEAILKACDELKTCFAQQQEEINELNRQARPTYAAKAGPRTVSKRDRTHSSNTDEANPQRHQATTRYNSVLKPTSPVREPWTLVERTKTRKKQPRDSKVQARPAGTSRRNRPPPPDAIAIKSGEGETFAEILKAVRKDVDVDKTGAHITSIAESRNGEVVIRVARGHSERAELETAISHALGSRATVRGLVKFEDLDISGLDGVTTEAEIIEALEKAATLPSSDGSTRWTKLDCAGSSEPGFRYISAGGIRYYSCYWSPNSTLADFDDFLLRLERSIRSAQGNIPLAGDFNTKHTDWGCSSNDQRGELLSDMVHTTGLATCNRGNSPTFRAKSILDVKFCSPDLVPKMYDWCVLDIESLSDHNYIQFHLTEDPTHTLQDTTRTKLRVDLSKLSAALNTDQLSIVYYNHQSADECAVHLVKKIQEICMTETSAGSQRKSVYWWSPEIANLRKTANYARRVFQRKRKRLGPTAATEEETAAKDAKRHLVKAIKKAKEAAWKSLSDQVENDPWGMPYKLVMAKLARSAPIPGLNCPDRICSIVNTLFPDHPQRSPDVWPPVSDLERSSFSISTEDVQLAARSLKNKVSPGPDGITNEAIKLIARNQPAMLSTTYNKCLRDGHFPSSWKKARLVLLWKGDKPLQEPSSYRPLCLLDSTGKLFEKIIDNRMRTFMEANDCLHGNQFGFRAGRSTTDAVDLLMTTESESGPNVRTGILTLDIQNAFNSAPWEKIVDAMRHMDFPIYLCRMISSYLSNRSVSIDVNGSRTEFVMTSGVPQGSVLGPTLWNILYDGLLRIRFPASITPIAFADDIALIATAREAYTLENDLTRAAEPALTWLEETGLKTALQKTEAMVITKKRLHNELAVNVGGHIVLGRNVLKYLGILIDGKLNFNAHAKSASGKASHAVKNLSRIMPNISAATPSRRRLLANVVHSLLLFGAPIWVNRMSSQGKSEMAKVQRKTALRVASAYRTVSLDAALVITDMPPVDLQAEERYEKYAQRHNQQPPSAGKAATVQKWQSRWDLTTKGRWTHRLIPCIATWHSRKYGEVNFHLSQALTGHGCFSAYLHKYCKLDSPVCWFCNQPIDDAFHTLFVCDAWESRRSRANTLLGTDMTPENLIPLMTKNKDSWAIGSSFIQEVMRKKEDYERRRQIREQTKNFPIS